MKKRVKRKWMAMLLLLGLCIGVTGGAVFAAGDEEDGSQDISISADLTSQDDSATYDVEVEVYNGGKDVSGTVRVLVGASYYEITAYDVPITLAEKSTKTCTVSIPKSGAVGNGSYARIQLLSEDGTILKDSVVQKLFQDSDYVMPVGILSDSYTKLTYLDLSGDAIYLMTDDYSIGLTEVTKDSLITDLNRLRYLVIDNYDTTTLDSSQIAAIQTWVRNGGMLIIGTGVYGDKTFAGFDDDFIEVELERSGNHQSTASVTDASSDDGDLDYIYQDYLSFCDNSLTMAYLDFEYVYDYMEYSGIGVKSEDDGSITVLNYSLCDDNLQAAWAESGSDGAYYLQEMVENLYNYAAEYSNYILYEDNYLPYWQASTAFSIMEGDTSLNMNHMKVIIIVYVLLIGPGIYLILKAVKKREYCWMVIPLLSLLFVGIVFIAGRGNQIKGINVYSVTISKADGSGKAKSYLAAYQAKAEEWELLLQDTVLYAGAGVGSDHSYYYYYSSGNISSRYNNRIAKTTDGYVIGYVPEESFDAGYFQAVGESTAKGGISYQISGLGYHSEGTVTNNTDRDFAYMLVLQGEDYLILSDVKAGETVDLSTADDFSSGSISEPEYFLYGEVEDAADDGNYEAAQALAALYIGLGEVYENDMTLVMGVTDDCSDVIKSDCNEHSWECLYESGVQ